MANIRRYKKQKTEEELRKERLERIGAGLATGLTLVGSGLIPAPSAGSKVGQVASRIAGVGQAQAAEQTPAEYMEGVRAQLWSRQTGVPYDQALAEMRAHDQRTLIELNRRATGSVQTPVAIWQTAWEQALERLRQARARGDNPAAIASYQQTLAYYQSMLDAATAAVSPPRPPARGIDDTGTVTITDPARAANTVTGVDLPSQVTEGTPYSVTFHTARPLAAGEVIKFSFTGPGGGGTFTQASNSQTYTPPQVINRETGYDDYTLLSAQVNDGPTFQLNRPMRVVVATSAATVVNLSITPEHLDLRTGGSGSLSAQVQMSDGTTGQRQLTWTSEHPAVATVDSSGRVTAVAPGETTITATVVGTTPPVFDRATVTVTAAPAITPITIQQPASMVIAARPGSPVNWLFRASGGQSGRFVWGMAPNTFGLSINPSSGLVSGTLPQNTPTGQQAVTLWAVDATDSTIGSGAQTFTFNVEPAAPAAQPLRITTTNILEGMVGRPYSTQLMAVGGSGYYEFAPTTIGVGLSVATDGSIAGTPTAPLSTTFPVTVFDARDRTRSATASLSIVIIAAPEEPGDTAPMQVSPYLINLAAARGGTVSTPFALTGGQGPFTWEIFMQPPGWGLSLAGSGRQATLTGRVPESAALGNNAIGLRVRDATGATAAANGYINVTAAATPPVAVTAYTVERGTVNMLTGSYQFTVRKNVQGAGWQDAPEKAVNYTITGPTSSSGSFTGTLTGTLPVGHWFFNFTWAAEGSAPGGSISWPVTVIGTNPAPLAEGQEESLVDVIVTDVNFTPTSVPQGGSYTSTIEGRLPSGAPLSGIAGLSFGAVFTYNDGPEQRVSNWQRNAVQVHNVPSDYPTGTYKLKKLFINQNNVLKDVWTGSKSITVTGPNQGNPPPAQTSGISIVRDNAGNPLAGVAVYDHDRVRTTGTGTGGTGVQWPSTYGVPGFSFPQDLQNRGLSPGNWTIRLSGHDFSPGMGIFMDGALGNFPQPGHPEQFEVLSPAEAILRIPSSAFHMEGITEEVTLVTYVVAAGGISDFNFITLDPNGGGAYGEYAQEIPVGTGGTGQTGPSVQIRPGQGTMRVGTTNAAGEIVYDDAYVQYLASLFPGQSVSAPNGFRTIVLPSGTTAIPGGLNLRYEYQNAKQNKAPTIAVVNNQTVLDASMTLNIGTATPPAQFAGISTVKDNAGNPLSGVAVFDHDRVMTTSTGGQVVPEPAINTPLVIAGFPDEISPGDWTIRLTGGGFGGINMFMYLDGFGNLPIEATSTTSGILRISSEKFAQTGYSNSYTSIGYFGRGERTTDYVFPYINFEGSGPTGEFAVPIAPGSTVVPGPTVQNRPGQGTMRVGTTNAQGEIVYDEAYVQYLASLFPGQTVSAPNGFRTIVLPNGTTAIPGGLNLRYEYQNVKQTKTPTIATVNGQRVLDASMTLNIGTATPPPAQTTGISVVHDNAGNPLAGVAVYDHDRVRTAGTADFSSVLPSTPIVVSIQGPFGQTGFPELSPSEWYIPLTGSGFAPGMNVYIQGLVGQTIEVYSPTYAVLRISPENFQHVAELAAPSEGYPGFYSGVAYWMRGERTSDFFFVNFDMNQSGSSQYATPPAPPASTAGPIVQIRPGQGTMRVGTTNAQGEIVYDEAYVQYLASLFPGQTVSAPNGFRTIVLPNGTTAIPGGLNLRYEYQNVKQTKTPTIATVNGQRVLDASMTLNIGTATPPPVNTVMVSDLNFNPSTVPQGGTITTTISGTFPATTVFGANYSFNGQDVTDPNWQTGPTKVQHLAANEPTGTYIVKRLFVMEKGQQKTVWTGSKIVNVIPATATSEPVVTSVEPGVLEQGKTTRVKVRGTGLGKIGYITSGAGITVPTASIVASDTKVEFDAVVSNDAALGTRVFNLIEIVSAQGATGKSVRLTLEVVNPTASTAPRVTRADPPSIRRGETTLVTLTGANLDKTIAIREKSLTGTTPLNDFQFTLDSVSATQVSFAVRAGRNVPARETMFELVGRDGQVAPFALTVTEAASAVRRVSVTPERTTLEPGQYQILQAQVEMADGSTNGRVTWSSSNEAVATVSTAGWVTGVSAGTAVITATSMDDPAKTASAIVTVVPAAANLIIDSITPEKIEKGIITHVVIRGQGLSQVRRIVEAYPFLSIQNISISGDKIEFNVTVDAGAPSGKLGFALATATNLILKTFDLEITGRTVPDAPVVATVAPGKIERGKAGQRIVITGQNLGQVSRISGPLELVEPMKYVTFERLTASENQVEVLVNVEADAPLNTFTFELATSIYDQRAQFDLEIVAPRTEPPPTDVPVITAVSPRTVERGATTRIRVDGGNLGKVGLVVAGRTVTVPAASIVAKDGSVEFDAIVSNDAPLGLLTFTLVELRGEGIIGRSVSGQINITESTRGTIVEDVKVSPDEVDGLYTGQTQQFTATVYLVGGATNSLVTWRSSNSAVATVNTDGLVTAAGPGRARIFATSQQDPAKNGSGVVVVKDVPMQIHAITPNKVEKGKTTRVTITGQNLGGITGIGEAYQFVTVSKFSAAYGRIEFDATVPANAPSGNFDFTLIMRDGRTRTFTLDIVESGMATPRVTSVAPNTVRRGEKTRVTVRGENLEKIGLVTAGAHFTIARESIKAKAGEVEFEVAAASAATLGRQTLSLVELLDSQGTIGKFAEFQLEVVAPQVAAAAPAIGSMTPRQGRADNTFTIEVRGQNLTGAAVTASGADIRTSNVQIFDGGTRLTFDLTIVRSAATGNRTITITNQIGSATSSFDVLAPTPIDNGGGGGGSSGSGGGSSSGSSAGGGSSASSSSAGAGTTAGTQAATGAPVIRSVTPWTVKRGQTTAVGIAGNNLAGAQIQIDGSDVAVRNLVINPNGANLGFDIVVNADAQPGFRLLRITTPKGVINEQINIEGTQTAAAQQETQQQAAPAARTYTVKKGDSLWKIAKQFYGNGRQWGRIYDANRGVIKNPRLIRPGQVLVIP